MAAVSLGGRAVLMVQALLLGLLYLFLYLPIAYLAYLSVMENSVWPFPPVWTVAWYERLAVMGDLHAGLANSLLIGLGTGALSALFATLGAVGILRPRARWRGLLIAVYVLPLLVAQVLIGIASLMFHQSFLGLTSGLVPAIPANATSALSCAFVVILAQLLRHDWRLHEVAMVCGARPLRVLLDVTLPIIWPAVLVAFLVGFALGFTNFEISFYTMGGAPTLPTVAWSTLRHGIEPELYALATLVNAMVLLVVVVIYLLIRAGQRRHGMAGR